VPPRLRRLLTQLGSFVLAGVLLYLALRGVDLDVVWEALREADYRWLLPLVAIVILSHWFRAWRWQMLLEALPADPDGAGRRRVSVKVAFYSVLIGYLVNYVAPRLGEIARATNLAAREKLPAGGVFGTVVVERLLDVLVLGLGLGSVFLLVDEAAIVDELFIAPVTDAFGRLPALLLLGGVIGLSVLVALLFRWAVRREESRLHQAWAQRVRPGILSFKDGLGTLQRTGRPVALLVSTAGIWFCYLLMAHVPFIMFGMTEAFDVSLLDSWSIMILGAVGMSVPSPGGTGSFHYITVQTLVHLFGFDASEAFTYAVVTHGAMLVLYVLLGVVCIVLQGSSLGTVRRAAQAGRPAETGRSEAPAPARPVGLRHGEEEAPPVPPGRP
jgi:uncharacterized protein (TIRG00374 family)